MERCLRQQLVVHALPGAFLTEPCLLTLAGQVLYSACAAWGLSTRALLV